VTCNVKSAKAETSHGDLLRELTLPMTSSTHHT